MKLSNTTLISLLLIFFTTFIHANGRSIFPVKINDFPDTKTLNSAHTGMMFYTISAKKILVTIKGKIEGDDNVTFADGVGVIYKRLHHGSINEKFYIINDGNLNSYDASLISDNPNTKSAVTISLSILELQCTGEFNTPFGTGYPEPFEILDIPGATKLIITVKGEDVPAGYTDIITIGANNNSKELDLKVRDGKIDENFTGYGPVIVSLKKGYEKYKDYAGLTVSIREDKGVNTDTQKPVLTLIGDKNVTLNIGDTYTDAGATATDNVDGNITSNIVSFNYMPDKVLPSEGKYSIYYYVVDSAGNVSSISRSIVVSEINVTKKPVITLIGDENISINVGDSYIDAGATAKDYADYNITSSIDINNTVDTTTAGTYTVIYTVTDNSGNVSTPVIRTVVVNEINTNPKPIITIIGDANVTLNEGEDTNTTTITANIDINITSNIDINNTIHTIVDTIEESNITISDSSTTKPSVTVHFYQIYAILGILTSCFL